MGRTVLGILAGVVAVARTATTSCAKAQQLPLISSEDVVEFVRTAARDKRRVGVFRRPFELLNVAPSCP